MGVTFSRSSTFPLLAFKRAGADSILTYFASRVAKWLKEGE